MAVVSKGSRTANASRVAQGTENIDFTLPNNVDHIILGCGVGDDNGDRMRVTDQFRLQWKTGGDAFVDLGTTGAVRFGLTDLVESNALTVDERLTTGLFGGYVNGEEKETNNPDTFPRQVRDDTTEMQWSLDFNFALVDTAYDFQVIWEASGTPFTVPYIAIITAVAAAVAPGAFLKRYEHMPAPNPHLRR